MPTDAPETSLRLDLILAPVFPAITIRAEEEEEEEGDEEEEEEDE